MPLIVINYGEQIIADDNAIEALVIPTNVNLHIPHLESGRVALEEAGDRLSDFLTATPCSDGESLAARSFNLRDSRGLRKLILSVISFTDKTTDELRESLTSYYRNSLATAKESNVNSLILPILDFEDTLRNIYKSFSVTLALNEVLDFADNNPHIEIYLRCESQECQALYQESFLYQEAAPTAVAEIPMPVAVPAFPIPEQTVEPSPEEEPVRRPQPAEEEKLEQRISANPWLADVPESLIGWHDFSTRKLEESIKDIQNNENNQSEVEKEQLKIKFYLGPNLYKIDCEFERSKAGELQWKHYINACNLKMLEKALEAVSHQIELWKYKYIFLKMRRQYLEAKFMDSKVCLDFVNFTQVKSDREFQNFLTGNAEDISFYENFYHKELRQGLSINGVRGMIRHILIKKDSLASVFSSNNDKKIAEKFKKEILKIVEAEISDPLKLREVIELKIKEVKSQLAEIEAEIEKLYELMIEKKRKEIINFMIETCTIAKQDNSQGSADSADSILVSIINFNNKASLMMKDGTLFDYYNKLEKKNPLRKILEGFLVKPEYRSLITAVKVLYDGSLSSVYSESIPELNQNLLFRDPLDWKDLIEFLSSIICKSPLQLNFRLKLFAYITERTNQSYFQYYVVEGIYRSESVNESKRFVSYLAGCLFLASAYEIDSGILFNENKSDFSVKAIGINFILAELQKINVTSSRLKIELLKILGEIKKDTYLYLEKDGNQDVIMNENLLFHKAISKGCNLRTVYSKNSDQIDNLLSLGIFGYGNFKIEESEDKAQETLTTKQRCYDAIL